MLPLGVLLVGMGAPALALAIYFRVSAKTEAEKVASEKTKTRGKKKGKKDKKGNRPKDQPGKERGTQGGLSLVLGGLVFTIAGIACLVRHFMEL